MTKQLVQPEILQKLQQSFEKLEFTITQIKTDKTNTVQYKSTITELAQEKEQLQKQLDTKEQECQEIKQAFIQIINRINKAISDMQAILNDKREK